MNAGTQDRGKRKDKGGGKDKRSKGKKQKGKGKGDGKLPSALSGAWKTVNGQTPCKWFNLGTCRSKTTPGVKCNIGLHLCMGPSCGEPHAFVDCP